MSAGKRRDKALHTAAETLRDHKTALTSEAVVFKVRGVLALAVSGACINVCPDKLKTAQA